MTAARLEIPLLALIKKADPTFFRDRAKVVEYEMSNGRAFTADPTTRGAFADTGGPDNFFSDETQSVDGVTEIFRK
jgi:hypothetical protein